MSTAQQVVIDAPGVYDLSTAVYHSDPVPGGSLSSTSARKLLPPSCPAKFHHWNTHGQDYNTTFELGHAAHTAGLGIGAPIVAVDAKDWKTKKAQTERDRIRADGKTPLLKAQYDHVLGMAKALKKHPLASVLLDPDTGHVEQSLFVFDEEFGVWRRAMLDRFSTDLIGDQYIIVDYKSCDRADKGAIEKSLANYGYGQQGAWYEDLFTALGLNEDFPVTFVLIFQEKDPPYLVNVAQPDPDAIMWGRRQNRKALDTYRKCRDADHWPGYSDEVISVGLPGWATYQHEAAYARGDYDIDTPEAFE